MTYLILALVGALVGALMPAKEDELFLGLFPLRVLHAILGAGLFCFLYFAGGGVNPDSY